MNAKDNVFSSYSFGAVFIEDAPTLPVTAPAVYWDETDSDTEEFESVSRPRLPNTPTGLRGFLNRHHAFGRRIPHRMAGSLAA